MSLLAGVGSSSAVGLAWKAMILISSDDSDTLFISLLVRHLDDFLRFYEV